MPDRQLSPAERARSTYAERDQRAHELLLRAAGAPPAERLRLWETVVLENLPAARALAHRYDSRGIEREDLEQVALLGLVHAVQRYEPGERPRFLAFATPTILGELRRYFRDKGWSIRPPRSLQEAAQNVRGAHDELVQQLGREPTFQETAEVTGLSPDQVREAVYVDNHYHASSLDSPIGTEPGVPLGDTLGTREALMDRVESFALLRAAIKHLSPFDQQILQLRFIEDLTQRQIGDRIGVSQMQISRRLSDILVQLRGLLEPTES